MSAAGKMLSGDQLAGELLRVRAMVLEVTQRRFVRIRSRISRTPTAD